MTFLRRVQKMALSPMALGCTVLGWSMMAVIGPFGMYAVMTFGARFVFWGVVSVLSLILWCLLQEAIALRLPRYSLKADALGWALFTLVFGPVVMVVSEPFRPIVLDGAIPPPEMLFVYVMVLTAAGIGLRLMVVQAIGVTADRHLRRPRMGADSVLTEAPAPRERPFGGPFLERLAAGADSRLILLTSKDHILEVHTDQGIETLRMRLADAVLELKDYDGAQVHRSHWVARDAVKHHEMRGGRPVLHLEKGLEVPVSRGYRDAARDAGVLQ